MQWVAARFCGRQTVLSWWGSQSARRLSHVVKTVHYYHLHLLNTLARWGFRALCVVRFLWKMTERTCLSVHGPAQPQLVDPFVVMNLQFSLKWFSRWWQSFQVWFCFKDSFASFWHYCLFMANKISTLLVVDLLSPLSAESAQWASIRAWCSICCTCWALVFGWALRWISSMPSDINSPWTAFWIKDAEARVVRDMQRLVRTTIHAVV